MDSPPLLHGRLGLKVGLNISSKWTEIMALNTIKRRPVQIDNEELSYTDRFHLSPVEMEELTWTSRAVSRTKLKLYYSCVLTTLPCMVQNVGA